MAMMFYGVSSLPLVRKLRRPLRQTQVWYADDAGAHSRINKLHEWFSAIARIGPKFGYQPKPTKSYLVVKQEYHQEAEKIFENSGINIVRGRRYMGGFIGDCDEKEKYVQEKIDGWLESLRKLMVAAETEPQASLCALQKSLQREWTFLCRVVDDISQLFESIQKLIFDEFLPSVAGFNLNEHEKKLFSLPCRYGGLGIDDPCAQEFKPFENSEKMTKIVSDAIKGETLYSKAQHTENLKQTKTKFVECF
eukprot:TRINITY_DN4596_c0_g1_i1.p2 TRINITY_DN4596_c0_g1~~TRINITY_DN4596_c0_g1_i1.p2  ORF type:complete len:250 (+),score=24.52 TRINITY_DN4596_c0_g1_i1:347-1096(+)